MTEPKLLATFGKPFRYQVAAFRLRLGNLLDTNTWEDVWQSGHDRGFMVAGATKAGILADVADAVDKAIHAGTGLEAFKRDFRRIIESRGWLLSPAGQGTKGGEAWRARLIYRTNMATSYAAGRMAQLVAGNYPFWVYRHGASLEPREQHLAWDGLILPPDHPFWATHAPPNGWGCSCYVLGARSMASAKILGGKPDLRLPDNWQALDPRTGAPIGIDKGWAYAPGASVVETVAAAAGRIATLPVEIGQAFGNAMQEIIARAWPVWLAGVEAQTIGTPGLVGVLSDDLVAALRLAGRAPVSADVMMAQAVITGPKQRRHSAVGDALTPEQLLHLPRLFREAQAAFIDTRSGKIVLLLPGDGPRAPQLAIELDQIVKRADRNRGPANLVVSAYAPRLEDIRGRIAGGLLSILFGAV